jgi:hypothetical protein
MDVKHRSRVFRVGQPADCSQGQTRIDAFLRDTPRACASPGSASPCWTLRGAARKAAGSLAPPRA